MQIKRGRGIYCLTVCTAEILVFEFANAVKDLRRQLTEQCELYGLLYAATLHQSAGSLAPTCCFLGACIQSDCQLLSRNDTGLVCCLARIGTNSFTPYCASLLQPLCLWLLQFEAFARGFMMLCCGPAIHLFSATELERLVCGNPLLDFDAMQANARYDGGYSPEHRVSTIPANA